MAGAETSTTTSTDPTTSTTLAPVTTTTLPVAVGLRIGSRGPQVVALQRLLIQNSYWLGAPNGVFGSTTEQAVYALQTVNNLPENGIVNRPTALALLAGQHLPLHTTSGNAIEVSIGHEVVMIVCNGHLLATLHTSTGGGYTYSQGGMSGVAVTPLGVFHTYYQVNKWDVGPLGGLYHPKYFSGGVALHGAYDIPNYPASHGCVRLSIPAMDWIWASNVDPLGTTIKVYK
jgi:peptidoglycan hydrolase-like protein with peptidoglycan-binding domain